MNKNILIFLLYLLPAVGLSQGAGQIKNRKIKEVITIETNQRDERENRKILERYDRKGRLIERMVFGTSNELRFHKKLRYLDRWGSNEEIVFEVPSGNVKSTTTTFFNKWREESKMEKRDRDGIIEQSKVWEYDKNGKLVKVISLGKNGVLVSLRELSYDKRGMILLDVTKDAQGNIVEQKSLEYIY